MKLLIDDANLEKIKAMGYLTKLDTNGSRPEILEDLVSRKLLDYVAMDIKNSPGKYAQTCGLPRIDLDLIDESISLLMGSPGRVYSRENLLDLVWGYEYTGEYRTVDVHIRRIREKVEADPANPELLRTKWGVGYYFNEND